MQQPSRARGAPPRRERNPEQTRRRILDAAEEQFALRGYDGVRLRDVAAGAGVHHALLHHYYRDKEGLFGAVLERALGAISSQAFELMRTTPEIRELIRRYVEVIVDFTAANENLLAIVHFAGRDEESPAFALCEEVAFKLILPLLEATARMVERAQRQGAVRRDVEARELVALAMGAAVHVFHEGRLFDAFFGKKVRSPERLAAHKRAAVRVVLDAVLAPDG